MQHLAPSLSSDYYHEISTPKTVACKRPSAIRDANFPAVEVTKRDDIFALAVTILMVSSYPVCAMVHHWTKFCVFASDGKGLHWKGTME